MPRLSSCIELVAVGLLSLSVSTSAAVAEDAALPIELGQPGAVLLEDHFDRDAPGDAWKAAKGDWSVSDGVLVGKELTSDKHAAVVSVGETHRNSIIRFRFKFDGAKQLHLSLNKAKGHLFRVVVNEQGLSLNLDKDKSNPDSKAVSLAKAQGVIEPNKWHTLQLEMVGDRVVARTDSGLKVAGQHADLDCPKPGYRFVVSGEAVRIDDVVVSAVK